MASNEKNRRTIAVWLFACCGMVFFMALLGAITRLTGSGLSITDWNPILGALPPLTEAAWQKAFSAYQAIPQYQILNQGMSLEEFKNIYFWEWFHRLWGRLTGIVFAFPLLWFFVRRSLDRQTGIKLAMILALGALQGFVGWFMVQSGLVVRTSVSPYRLALHLGFALLIYGLLLWMACDQLSSNKPAQPKPLRKYGWAVLGLLAITIIWGAFVAGLHAGEAYNTWPLMEGEFLPDAAWTLQPDWLNIFENLALVQFTHRWLAPLTMLAILGWAALCWKKANRRDRKWLLGLILTSLAQVGLGLATLLTRANIVFAVLHQAGAIALLTFMLISLHRLSGKTKLHR